MNVDKIKLWWFNDNNFGDQIGPYLVHKLTGKKVVYVEHLRLKTDNFFLLIRQLVALIFRNGFITSFRILYQTLIVNKLFCVGSIIHRANYTCHVWGSGLIEEKDSIHTRNVYAVRGPVTKSKISNSINSNISLSHEWVDFLLENPQTEIIPKLLERYSSCHASLPFAEETKDLERVLLAYPKDDFIPILYSCNLSEHQSYIDIIQKGNLFDAKSILRLLDINFHVAIILLETAPDYYTKTDLEYMKQIVDKLDNLPNTGTAELSKGGLLGKAQMKFICENGHKSFIESEYCENPNCGVNIKGLSKPEVNKINKFKTRIDILSTLLSNM